MMAQGAFFLTSIFLFFSKARTMKSVEESLARLQVQEILMNCQWIKEIQNEKNSKKCPVIIERNNFQSEAQINFFFCLTSIVTRTNFVRRIRPFWLGVETEHLLLLLCSAGLCGPDPDPWRGVLCLSRSGIPVHSLLSAETRSAAFLNRAIRQVC